MAKTDFLTADMTRRQFMKLSGKGLAGVALSSTLPSLTLPEGADVQEFMGVGSVL